MGRKPHPSDLTEAEWAILESLLPSAKRGRRPRTVAMHQVLNAIFYVLENGCQWDMLRRDFPPRDTDYHYYNTWRKVGTWQCINQALREQLRQRLGREATPSASIINSQSVKTTEKGRTAYKFILSENTLLQKLLRRAAQDTSPDTCLSHSSTSR